MSSTPASWTVQQVMEWFAGPQVGLGTSCDQIIQTHKVDGDLLLKLDRRQLDKLGFNPMHLRKIEFAIHKLKEGIEQQRENEASTQREAIVAQKMEQIKQGYVTPGAIPDNRSPGPSSSALPSATSAATPPPQNAGSDAEPAAKRAKLDESSATAEKTNDSEAQAGGGLDEAKARQWTTDEVLQWLQKAQLDELAAQFKEGAVTGAKLLSTAFRQLLSELKLMNIDLPQRRKLELEISRLQERVKAREDQDREIASRTDKATITNPSMSNFERSYMKVMANNIYFYRDVSPELVQFGIQNNSTSDHIYVKLVVDNSEGGLNIDDKQITAKLWIPPKSARLTILEVRPNDPSMLWTFAYTCESRIGTIMDFLECKDNMVENALNGYKSWLNTASTEGLTESEIAKLCQRHGTHFIDPAFPPTKVSLYLDMEDASLVKDKDILPIQWKRPREFFKQGINPTMFQAGQMSPSDILQGRLGDCWFLAALSVIARKPELVHNLLLTKETNETGVYAMQFFRAGQWQRVVIDDHLPCAPISGNMKLDIEALIRLKMAPSSDSEILAGPIYAGSKKNDLWVALLEKAYAKLNKSYQALTAGSFQESLYDLTGAPALNHVLVLMNDPSELWNEVLEAGKAGLLMGASSKNLLPEEKAAGQSLEALGIVERHAYALLDVKEVDGVRLLRLRNPWGGFVWKGDYSDNSNKWTQRLKAGVNFQTEPGTFWIAWNDFKEHFGEVTICKLGVVDRWPHQLILRGEYTDEKMYGPQFAITVKEKTKLFVLLSKTDTRFAVGADKDNRHGLYLLRKNPKSNNNGYRPGIVPSELEFNYEHVADSWGDWSRRDVSFEIELEPSEEPYLLVVSARIGSVKFESINWICSISSEKPVEVVQRPVPSVRDLLETVLCYMKKYSANKYILESTFFTLHHYAFYHDNRQILADLNALPFVFDLMKKYLTDRHIHKEGNSLIWNLSYDIGVRAKLNEYNVKEILQQSKDHWYKNEEIQETAVVALRTLSLQQGVAQDPLIEKCVIAGSCTFAVTGDRSYLLQMFFDCYTCRLRGGYGICCVCAEVCHKGHSISPPHLGRFFCDCGHGSKTKKGLQCKCLKERQEIGLSKKREFDEDYKKDEDDEPDPFPVPLPRPGPGPRKQNGGGKPKGDGPRTIFDL